MTRWIWMKRKVRVSFNNRGHIFFFGKKHTEKKMWMKEKEYNKGKCVGNSLVDNRRRRRKKKEDTSKTRLWKIYLPRVESEKRERKVNQVEALDKRNAQPSQDGLMRWQTRFNEIKEKKKKRNKKMKNNTLHSLSFFFVGRKTDRKRCTYPDNSDFLKKKNL